MLMNNLYPPVMDSTYAPSFLIDSEDVEKNSCKIYFSLSPYNSRKEIASVQISLVDQDTNITVLDKDKYPCGIMISDLKGVEPYYYVEIKREDLKGKNFELNRFYKAQIRFTSIEAEKPPIENETQSIDSWLTRNLSYFSEWSRGCLVRGTSTPKLKLIGFDNFSNYTVFNTPFVEIIGTLSFKNSAEEDFLNNYQITLYDNENQVLLKTEKIYTNKYNNTNNLNYIFKYGFLEGQKYRISIEIQTKYNYTETLYYDFLVMPNNNQTFEGSISAQEDNLNGRAKISIKANPGEHILGNVCIKRTDSKSDFLIWEDLHTDLISIKDNQQYTWFDYTVENGIWYKYCVQKVNSLGLKGVVSKSTEPIIIDFEDILLKSAQGQLKVKFNPSISGFKYNIAESKTDTIGSPYPFINRNGALKYRTFGIAGLISYFMDEENLFSNKEDLLGMKNLELYQKYNTKNRIDDYTDTHLERSFREKVIDFLMKNDVKLYRSAQEGNIIIKLMDVNFVPVENLGRHLYSFSATAVEIDEFSIENCNKYKIQESGAYQKDIRYETTRIGQQSQVFKKDVEVLQTLKDRYQKDSVKGFETNIDNIENLHITFDGPPYLIGENENGPYPIEKKEGRLLTNNSNQALIAGYLVYINEKPIIVNEKGYYELDSNNVKVTSIVFPVDTLATLDYKITLNQTEKNLTAVQNYNYYQKIGQLWGAFDYKDSIYKKIWNKYYKEYSSYRESLLSIDDISIEANPNTIVYLKESEDKGFQKHIIGDTELLNIKNDKSYIQGIYFAGMHLEPATAKDLQRDVLPSNKYYKTNLNISDLTDLKTPLQNGVYNLNEPVLYYLEKEPLEKGLTVDKEYCEEVQPNVQIDKIDKEYSLLLTQEMQDSKEVIWYKGQWYPFVEGSDLICAVPASINYSYEICKEVFK